MSEPLGLLLVVGVGTLVVFVVLLVLQSLIGWFTGGAIREQTLLERVLQNAPATDWEGRVDRAVDRLARGTHLGLSSAQLFGGVFLTGVLLACGLFAWTLEPWAILVGLVIGQLVALAFFWVLRSRWQNQLRDQLPDGLFLLAQSLRAGLTLEQAIESVRGYCPSPLTEVLEVCARQIRLGLSPRYAVDALAEEIDLPDYRALASVVELHQGVGGNLAVLLDRLATSIRDRNQLRQQVATMTALGRLSATFLALAPMLIACGYYAVAPDLFWNFFRDSFGWTMLGGIVLLESVGLLWLGYLLRRLRF